MAANGALLAASGIGDVNKFGQGRYSLTTNTDVTRCALTGMINTDGGDNPGPGSASILVGAVSPRTLFVRTATPSGPHPRTVDDDRPFSVRISRCSTPSTRSCSGPTPPRPRPANDVTPKGTIMSHRARLLAGLVAATFLALGAGVTPATADSVYGPYAGYEVCWVSGNQGQQAGQWVSYFCAQNGTPNGGGSHPMTGHSPPPRS
ncbi:hypothetical protein [Nonomuraea fuscirosea]|uniref:hypothetical protein n=1 Tax=Nonomuraea fuscirosea TaxID=1291556 RepID=UPI0033D2EB23